MTSLSRLAHPRDLLVVLVGRDLRVSYGNALLGLVWAPLSALTQVAVLSFLFLRVVPLDLDDYPLFLFVGIVSWQLFLQSMLGGTEAFTNNRDLVARPGFPVGLLPIVSIGTATAGYLLTLPVVIGFAVIAGRADVELLALPIPVFATGLLAVGPTLVAASLNVRFRDIRYFIGAILTVGFYLTPVFYDASRVPPEFSWVVDLNPVAILVGLHRDVLYEGSMPDSGGTLTVLVIGAVLAVGGLAVFRRVEPQLADGL